MLATPFDRIASASRPRVFVIALISTVATLALVRAIDAPLRTGISPAGVVDLQLAFSAERARALVDSWSATQQLWCALGLGVDGVFMLAYPCLAAAACVFFGAVWSAQTQRPVLLALARVCAWFGLASGVADAVENVFLMKILVGDASVAGIASATASFKFACIGVAALFGVVAAIAVRFRLR